MPSDGKLIRAQDALPPNIYIKRPNLSLYDVFQEHNVLNIIPKGLVEEARARIWLSAPIFDD